jgi:hypothetical protein
MNKKKLLKGAAISFTVMCTVFGLFSLNQWFFSHRIEFGIGSLWLIPPSIMLGSWLAQRRMRPLKKSEQELELSERELENVFLQFLLENQGNATAISFAIASKLSLAEAQGYLEIKSNQLNSAYQLDANGAVFYHFPMLNSNQAPIKQRIITN